MNIISAFIVGDSIILSLHTDLMEKFYMQIDHPWTLSIINGKRISSSDIPGAFEFNSLPETEFDALFESVTDEIVGALVGVAKEFIPTPGRERITTARGAILCSDGTPWQIIDDRLQ